MVPSSERTHPVTPTSPLFSEQPAPAVSESRNLPLQSYPAIAAELFTPKYDFYKPETAVVAEPRTAASVSQAYDVRLPHHLLPYPTAVVPYTEVQLPQQLAPPPKRIDSGVTVATENAGDVEPNPKPRLSRMGSMMSRFRHGAHNRSKPAVGDVAEAGAPKYPTEPKRVTDLPEYVY